MLIARKTIMKLFIPFALFGIWDGFHQVLMPQCRVAKPATSPPWKSQDWEGATERVYLNALSPGDWLNKKGIYRYPPKTSPRGRDNLWESIGIPDMIQHEMGSGSSIGPPGGERWQMAPTAILWCDMVRMVWYGAIHSGDSQQNFNYLSQRWTLVEVSDQRSGQEKKRGLGSSAKLKIPMHPSLLQIQVRLQVEFLGLTFCTQLASILQHHDGLGSFDELRSDGCDHFLRMGDKKREHISTFEMLHLIFFFVCW